LLAARLGVTQLRTAAYNPGANGTIERMHRSLAAILKQLEGERFWPTLLPYVTMLLNSAVCRSTGMSPHQIIFGSALEMPFDVLSAPVEDVEKEEQQGVTLGVRLQQAWRSVERMQQAAHEVNKSRVDRSRIDVQPADFGPFVFVYEVTAKQGGKFSKSWSGPYRVVEFVSTGLACIVEHPQSGRRRTVHVDRLQSAPIHALDEVMADSFEDTWQPVAAVQLEGSVCNWCGRTLGQNSAGQDLCVKCRACQYDGLDRDADS
jgi:hypothetical protein